MALAATEHFVLGLMSGSSLDGLDLAVCRFVLTDEAEPTVTEWSVLAAETDPYPRPWQARLRSAPHLPGRELWRLHADLGHWFGQRARAFLDRHPDPRVTLAGSHGHTIFHYPGEHFTTQIGDGAALAHRLGLPVVAELRGADVAAGGQGAPLAPLADRYLFPEYEGFLNLGGIANLSWRGEDGLYLAGDITGCCQVLDRLAQRAGQAYDAGGQLARSGRPLPAVAEAVAALPFHQQAYPKSLGNDWVREQLWPLLDDRDAHPADLLHTFVRWLARKIAYDFSVLPPAPSSHVGAAAGAGESPNSQPVAARVLVSGGGARNDYLLDCLRATRADAARPLEFVTADPLIGDFKEAALVALAALFRQRGVPNALPSATGAPRPTVNGALFHP